jgi:hypothetical protein
MLANVVRLQSSDMSEAVALLADTMKILVQQSAVPTPVVAGKGWEQMPPMPEIKPVTVEPMKMKTVYARVGDTCRCDECAKVVYEVKEEVYDGMPKEDFKKAFKRVGHTVFINPDWPYRNIDGCMMTTCPLCQTEEGLVLWGKRPVEGKGISLGSSVDTLSEEEIRSL